MDNGVYLECAVRCPADDNVELDALVFRGPEKNYVHLDDVGFG